MSEELMRGGMHRVYLRALNSVRDLLLSLPRSVAKWPERKTDPANDAGTTS
jgi:hypothetical protein